MLEISTLAAQEIRRMQASRSMDDRYFFIGITPGGCGGHSYVFDLRAQVSETETTCTIDGIKIAIATEQLPQLQGMKLDYGEDLMGGNFRITNPQAQSVCNCGQSFSL